ncbi:hypothetical protein ACLOJK_030322 [Asimina triloba]
MFGVRCQNTHAVTINLPPAHLPLIFLGDSSCPQTIDDALRRSAATDGVVQCNAPADFLPIRLERVIL